MKKKVGKLIGIRLPVRLENKINARIENIRKMSGVRVSKQRIIEACLNDVYLGKEA